MKIQTANIVEIADDIRLIYMWESHRMKIQQAKQNQPMLPLQSSCDEIFVDETQLQMIVNAVNAIKLQQAVTTNKK